MHLILDKLNVLGRWVAGHKYLFVTIVFLVIIIVVDDNNMISHIRNNAVISELNDEIRAMEARMTSQLWLPPGPLPTGV